MHVICESLFSLNELEVSVGDGERERVRKVERGRP